MNEDALKAAKNRLDMILSDRQKQEIAEKLKNTDRNTLLNMLSSIDLSGITGENIENLIKNTDAEEIMKKFKNM